MTGYESKRAAAQDKLDSMEREALKMALEALELLSQQPTDSALDYADNAINALRERLAQPAQEPVAWPCVIAEANFEQNTITLEMQCSNYKVGAGQHWLYTAPPQRPWVGLTDEEAQWLYDNCRTPSNLIDMVEAKLKEKNA